MAKLTMGTEGAFALQHKIQSELATRGYSSENDPVMAEYITIMVINDKTPEQINSELADLIGPEYESTFTDWLFEETTKVAAPVPVPVSLPAEQTLSGRGSNLREDIHPNSRRTGAGAGLLQNALSSVHPPTGPSASRSNYLPQPGSGAQKRTASARSPSPSSSSLPNKARRTDAPTGPRAMMDRPLGAGNQPQSGRSLIDRVGPHSRRGSGGGHGNLSPAQVSHIRAKIDGITDTPVSRHPMNGRGQGPVPMNGGPAMNISLQEMMVMNWDMMRQMANTIGMMGPAGPVGNFGFPQQNVGGIPQQQQMGGFQPGAPSFVPGQGMQGRGGMGRSPGRGGMGGGRGRGASASQFVVGAQPQSLPPPPAPALAPAPAPAPAPAVPGPSISGPERPGTPSLCKYGLKCTNPQCRFSHPSPVATVESGVVLSTEFCPKGKDCKDKHCTLGHVSPSLVNGTAKPVPSHAPPAPVPAPATSLTPCKFGLACTRPGCMFTHPPNFRPPQQHNYHPAHQQQPATGVPCRFGASCTRTDCPFQHPKGHVSANMFYRGLGPDAPLVEGYVSPHRSVRFGSELKAELPTAKQDKEKKKDENDVEAVALGKEKIGEKAVGVSA
ncbi:hypothetical protein JB92DRAFT_1627960 [Gautieria morchelliformis]|nr:hypothetical protein JB92DRAFT_1627960 [Gautieria morchelliformis]